MTAAIVVVPGSVAWPLRPARALVARAYVAALPVCASRPENELIPKIPGGECSDNTSDLPSRL